MEHLQCSIKFFKEFIEFQFYDGMTWDNYNTEWNLAFVRHPSTFSDDEFHKAFSWKNITPLKIDRHLSYAKGKRNYISECLQEYKVKMFRAHSQLASF
jgi:hypothetical protein